KRHPEGALCVLLGKRKLGAAIAGIVLASAPLLALQYLLDRYIDKQGFEEVEATAKRGMRLAENRIRRSVSALTELARSGAASCKPSGIAALNAAALHIVPVKELAVIGPDGATLCTNLGLPTAGRQVVSSEAFAFAANSFIDIIAMPLGGEHFVRIRRMDPDGSNGLAALIPSELVLPQVSNTGGPLRVYTGMVSRDGTLIGERGARPQSGQPAAD